MDSQLIKKVLESWVEFGGNKSINIIADELQDLIIKEKASIVHSKSILRERIKYLDKKFSVFNEITEDSILQYLLKWTNASEFIGPDDMMDNSYEEVANMIVKYFKLKLKEYDDRRIKEGTI